MTKNIDLLLEKLSNDGLAHELIRKLRESQRQDWPQVLDEGLKTRLEQKVRELKDAEDQNA
ncbi:MAG: hypothetical protein D6690_09490 [Nitrospirae bacterium]|nr:MAG: hypothetical protein D6690_09490 [Nitrospirota bacterium]